jgi:hypothetical protein
MDNQFLTLQNWTQEVLNAIKKDLKNDHLHTDPVFYKTYFGNRPQNRLTTEEIFSAYEKELVQGNNDLAEFVVNRWVFKHGDLYQHFAERLSQINPDFEQIQHLTDLETETVLAGAAESFGAIPTFLFAVLNGVVFPQPAVERLRKAAQAEKEAREKNEANAQEQQTFDKLIAAHKREVARLESKIEGVQKKYITDTEALKKQIKALQKKLNG